jgi:hypothetical protein
MLPENLQCLTCFILSREASLKGEGSVQLTSLYLSTADLLVLTSLVKLNFYTENIIYHFYNTSYLNEEVNCTDPSPSVSTPCFGQLVFSSAYICDFVFYTSLPEGITDLIELINLIL